MFRASMRVVALAPESVPMAAIESPLMAISAKYHAGSVDNPRVGDENVVGLGGRKRGGNKKQRG